MTSRKLTFAYSYRAGFPRVWDSPRVPWRRGLLDEALALPDVVEAYLPQIRAGWTGGARGSAIESRRDVIEIITSSSTLAASVTTRAAVIDWLDRVRAERGASRLIVDVVAVDVTELGP